MLLVTSGPPLGMSRWLPSHQSHRKVLSVEMLAVVCLALVWAGFLVPPMVRRHREGRPGSSVTSFRRQLSTLERATPGTSLRPPVESRSTGSLGPAPLRRSELQQRRQNVLLGLGGATAVTFLLVIALGGTLAVLLFVASAGTLGAYVYALVQIRQRASEAASKVRVLHPQARQASYAAVPARRTAAR